MFLEVLNLCLHQPLKCFSRNLSVRASLLLSPRFFCFHAGKKMRSPLCILRRGKSKHTEINKAVNRPTSPRHQVPTKPRWQKVSAEGRGPPGAYHLQPPLVAGPLPCPSHRGCQGGLRGGFLPAQPLSYGDEPLAAGFTPGWPYSPVWAWGCLHWGVSPPWWVDKRKPTEEEEEAAGITRGIARQQDHPAIPIITPLHFHVGKLEEKKENPHPEKCP